MSEGCGESYCDDCDGGCLLIDVECLVMMRSDVGWG